MDEVSDISGFVFPHTRVDILVATQGEGNGTATSRFEMVLQNVEVLAVAQEVEKKKDEPEIVKVVTVLVTPQEAERLRWRVIKERCTWRCAITLITRLF